MNYQQGYRPPPTSLPRQKKRRRRLKSSAIYILAGLAAVAVIAVAVTLAVSLSRSEQDDPRYQELRRQVDPYQSIFLPNTYIDGVNIGGMTLEQGRNAVMNQIGARQNSWSLDLTYQYHVYYTLTYASLGIQTDTNQAEALIQELFRRGKPADESAAAYEQSKTEIESAVAEPVYAFTTQSEQTDVLLDSLLSQIQDELASEPTDAYLAYFAPDQKDPFVIQPENYGARVDLEEAKRQILEMAAEGKSGAFEFVVTPIAPQVTAADVRRQVSLLYKATTPISSSSTTYRTDNIRTALSRVNGTVLAPGEQFFFNKIVLTRTEKNGYKPAIEYGEGGFEQVGIGGGVCQASTTVYLAAIQSGLKINERHAHSNPVSYTTFGQDATVSDGRLDLVFTNTSGGTIYITARVENVTKSKYQCVVCIYGPSLGGVSYALRTETIEILPAPQDVVYQKDKNHTYVTYKDEDPVLIQEARDGFVNRTYLQKWENGVLVEEKRVSDKDDVCKARSTVYAVGTKTR